MTNGNEYIFTPYKNTTLTKTRKQITRVKVLKRRSQHLTGHVGPCHDSSAAVEHDGKHLDKTHDGTSRVVNRVTGFENKEEVNFPDIKSRSTAHLYILQVNIESADSTAENTFDTYAIGCSSGCEAECQYNWPQSGLCCSQQHWGVKWSHVAPQWRNWRKWKPERAWRQWRQWRWPWHKCELQPMAWESNLWYLERNHQVNE